jgi:hypothetical protein
MVLGYGYSSGEILTDPALPIEDVSNEAHIGVLGFAHVLNVFGQSAKVDFIVPFAGITATGLVFGQPHTRQISGFGDPFFRFSVNLFGAPALRAAEFKSYQQDVILGGSVRVGVPLGQYDDTRLVNVGSNRWSIKPEIGASKAFGRLTLELAPAVTFYTDNDNFFGGKTRAQSPLYAVQGHISYTFRPGLWLGLDAVYFNGGQSTVDGSENEDRHEGTRWGATLAVPLSRYQSIKLYALTGYNADRDHDISAVGIAWQYRWGGGF